MTLQPTASPLVHRYTLKEFFALDAPPGGGHYELIAGVLYVVPPPDLSHGLAASRMVYLLSAYADAHSESCTLFVPRTAIWTADDTYLEPDLFLVRSEDVRRAGVGHLTTAALVVEVLSPSTRVYDRTAKADTYAALGVEELWLVDLATQSIEQRIRQADIWQVKGTYTGDAVFEAAIFPDLVVVPNRIFVA